MAFNRTHTTAVDPNFKYEICDKTGRALTKEGNTYIYSVDSTTVKLKNIKFDRVTGTFDFTDLETEPLIDRNELELSITAKKENINGLNFVLNKPLKINLLHYNQLAKPAGREPVLEDVNNQP
ncbi:MAG: hypothetical protein LBH96_04515 [Candidatus Peribacteria bacterium]|nr:hypothetical protein [Candidatus Peribacteria bacterium]